MRTLTLDCAQAGTRLLIAAIRDTAPVLTPTTFGAFMKAIENGADTLTETEKADPRYRDHVTCFTNICMVNDGLTPGGDGCHQVGSHVTETLLAYAVQVVDLLPLFHMWGDTLEEGTFLQQLQDALALLLQEVHEMPGGPDVQNALTTFVQCWQEIL